MSETLDLFKAALGLAEPWRVTRSDFDVAQGRLDLYLDFPRGARFGCAVPGCDQGSCPVHDTEAKTWRHMDFFQYKAFLHARVPRTRCPEHGVHLVDRRHPPGERGRGLPPPPDAGLLGGGLGDVVRDHAGGRRQRGEPPAPGPGSV